MCKELKRISIQDGDMLPFVWRTDNLGRAEFDICPIYKYGNLKEIFIIPRQQKDIDYYYHWQIDYNRQRSLTFGGYEGLNEPKIWRLFWCKEHKTNSIELYVPNDSKYLWFTVFSDNVTIGFTKTKW